MSDNQSFNKGMAELILFAYLVGRGSAKPKYPTTWDETAKTARCIAAHLSKISVKDESLC